MIQLSSINQLNNSLAEREAALAQLSMFIDDTGVLVQTCNRIEHYFGTGLVPSNIARHLFRVVSGLESSLIGEIAIQRQIKNVYQEACEKYKLDKGIHNLFQTAILDLAFLSDIG